MNKEVKDRNPTHEGDSHTRRQAELLELAYVALKAAGDYMERQYDGYYRDLNQADSAKVEHAIAQISGWKLGLLASKYE